MRIRILFFCTLAMLAGTLCAEEINVLIFGNSYSHGGLDELPKIAAAMGDHADVICLRGMAANFVKAARQEESGTELISVDEAKKLTPWQAAEAGYVTLESDYKARVPVIQTLKSRKWDFVVFQCHSSQANNRSIWGEDARTMREIVQEYAPDAEFLLYFTTQYRNDGLLYGTEANQSVYRAADDDYPYTEDEHFLDCYEVYYGLAKDIGCRVIPGGTSFQNARYCPDWPYEQFPDPDFDYTVKSDQLPAQEKSIHFGMRWRNKTSKSGLTWTLDSHPNAIGNYLTGCVYYGMLFGKSPVGCSYRPSSWSFSLTEEEAGILQKVAWETVEGKMPPLRLENPTSVEQYNLILKKLDNPGIGEAVNDPDYFEKCRKIWEEYGSKAL